MQLLSQATEGEPRAEVAPPRRAFSGRDRWPLLALAALFAVMLAASWLRWTQPIIDHGREMNLPARVLAGDQLYRDVQYLYGPFAPYFNALLYRLFGVHLATLQTSGTICAVLIILMIYWLARQLLSPWEAAAAAGLALVICAIKPSASYMQPYSYGALYALLCALGALVCTFRYLQSLRSGWLIWVGAATGLALISKPEIAAAALASAGTALLLGSPLARRLRWREALLLVLPIAAIVLVAYAFILSRVSWRTLIEDNHVLFSNMPPQLVYFNGYISGLNQWPRSFWYTMSGVGMLALWIGVSALVGALVARRQGLAWRPVAWRALAVIVLAGVGWKLVVTLSGIDTDASPLTAAPLVLPVLIGAILWRGRRKGVEGLALDDRLLLVLAVFGGVAILRALVNVKTTGPYAQFFVPALTIIFPYLLLRSAPALLAPAGPLRDDVRGAALALIAVMVVGMAANSIYRFRSRNTFEIAAPRGGFVTEPPIGQPIAQALRYLAERTSPDDEVLVLPQATAINFLAERRYPFFEEIVHPGFLTGDHEAAAIRRIEERRIPVILVVNLLTPEFRDRVFGVDYNRDLMRWISEHYRLQERFDSDYSRGRQFGDQPFFILAYERPE